MGANKPLPQRLAPEREKLFPTMVQIGYTPTSHESDEYNCIAYAAGDYTQWWDPIEPPEPGYYWPQGTRLKDLPQSITLEDDAELEAAFMSIGYERCQSGEVEEGYEKVALYVKNGDWTHAAKQLPDGSWSSKLGRYEDVTHTVPECFIDSSYGKISRFMRRPLAKRGDGNETEGSAPQKVEGTES